MIGACIRRWHGGSQANVTTFGLDTSKNVMQVHWVDEQTGEVRRRTLKRAQLAPFFARRVQCRIVLEACGSGHYQGRTLLALSKRGDPYLRTLLRHGARAVIFHSKAKSAWLQRLLARRPLNAVVAALANKMARTAWALVAHGRAYQAGAAATAALPKI